MEDAAPISLYLDLEPGQVADLEVVARAAIAWAEAIKEIAYILDPSMEVKIELASGTEGSLSLNSLVRKIRGAKLSKSDLRTIVIAVATWFALQTLEYGYQRVLDFLTGKDAPTATQGMTPEQLDDMARRIADHLSGNVAQPQRQQMYRELERDSAVRGVGVTTTPQDRPTLIIPRSDFGNLSGATVETSTVEKRTTTSRVVATLISPTLKDAPRSWRFQIGSMDEFGATMKDQAFLDAVVEGRVSIPLRAGVEMEFELVAKEEHEGGVWTVKERAVTQVYRPEVSRSNELPL